MALKWYEHLLSYFNIIPETNRQQSILYSLKLKYFWYKEHYLHIAKYLLHTTEITERLAVNHNSIIITYNKWNIQFLVTKCELVHNFQTVQAWRLGGLFSQFASHLQWMLHGIPFFAQLHDVHRRWLLLHEHLTSCNNCVGAGGLSVMIGMTAPDSTEKP